MAHIAINRLHRERAPSARRVFGATERAADVGIRSAHTGIMTQENPHARQVPCSCLRDRRADARRLPVLETRTERGRLGSEADTLFQRDGLPVGVLHQAVQRVLTTNARLFVPAESLMW